MTPREALETLSLSFTDGSDAELEARSVLERLVSKDEADTKFAQGEGVYRVTKTEIKPITNFKPWVCTCGTVTPCRIWGHS